jgi:hypothetical protein
MSNIFLLIIIQAAVKSAFISGGVYSPGEEFNFAYMKMFQPTKLLAFYGYVPNENPHSK